MGGPQDYHGEVFATALASMMGDVFKTKQGFVVFENVTVGPLQVWITCCGDFTPLGPWHHERFARDEFHPVRKLHGPEKRLQKNEPHITSTCHSHMYTYIRTLHTNYMLYFASVPHDFVASIWLFSALSCAVSVSRVNLHFRFQRCPCVAKNLPSYLRHPHHCCQLQK